MRFLNPIFSFLHLFNSNLYFPTLFVRAQYCGRSFTIFRTIVRFIAYNRPQYCARLFKRGDLRIRFGKT